MPTHPDSTRNVMINAVTALLNVGTGLPQIVFLDGVPATVASVGMDGTTAFAAAASGIATATLPMTDDTSAVGGTMARVELRDRDGALVIDATIGTTGTDFIVSSLVVPVGATVTVSSLTYTAPA